MLWGNGADETFTDIVMGIRFPRAMAAAILGGGLALSGYLLQTFFHRITPPYTDKSGLHRLQSAFFEYRM